jgi:class 3 adenylate cyclase
VDASLVGKIVNMASRLQIQHDETLTESQIESIGAEIGLEPSFIQQALAQLEEGEPKTPIAVHPKKLKFWMTASAFILPVIWGTLSMLFSLRDVNIATTFFTIITAIPMAVLLGYLTGKKDLAQLAAMELVAALAPSTHGHLIPYLIFGLILSRKLAERGVELREEHDPLKSHEGSKAPVSRRDLLNLLMRLENQLEVQLQQRTFLSVDIVGSSMIAQSADPRDVEFTFHQFHRWLELIVQRYGGEVWYTAGDGSMCAFKDERSALRAARQLLESMSEFNRIQNRLAIPLQIRCGVCAGGVALEEGVPLNEIQSPVMYRAAMLQKRAEPGGIVIGDEVMAAVHDELTGLTPLPDPPADRPAYTYRATEQN